MTSRVSIIGKGIVGLSCAFRFAQAGFRVTLIYSDQTQTASAVATGISTLKGHRTPRDLLFKMKVKGHACFREQLQSLATDGVIFGEGVFEPFRNDADQHHIVSRVYAGLDNHDLGNSCHKTVDMPQCFFSTDVSGYLHYPADLWCDASSLLEALTLRCKLLGVEFVEALVHWITLENEGDCSFYQVIAERPLPRADEIFVCAGSDTTRILRASGFSLDGFSAHPAATLLFPSRSKERFAFVHNKEVFVHANGGLRVGSFEIKGPGDEREAKRSLFALASSYVRDGFFEADGAELCAAERLRYRKMLPFVGKLGGPKPFWVVTGLYKNGFQLADYIARNLVIHVIKGEFTDPELSQLYLKCQEHR